MASSLLLNGSSPLICYNLLGTSMAYMVLS
jgi:hypothetical protein